jgi:uncharacterized protein (TIGR02147 family)
MALVQYNQARTATERERALQEMTDLSSRKHPARLGERQYDVFSKWWHVVIREIISLPDFRFSPDWIASALAPSITPAQALESLALLSSLGLIVQQRDRAWTQAEKALATDARVRSGLIKQFHREMIKLGAESLARFPADQREIGTTTLRVSKADLETIKIWLREFRMKLLGLATQSAGADQVYQLNFQFFPVVDPKRPSASGGPA